MPELRFRVASATALEHAASPLIELGIELRAVPEQRIESVLLRCAVRIDVARAGAQADPARLRELFGPKDAWSRSSRSLLWTQATVIAPAFDGVAQLAVQLPCSYDLAAAASKYLQGVREGEVPITVQFSGTVFYREGESLQAAPIAWDREASFVLPAALFHAVIEQHFPNAGVLALRRDVYDRLDSYRIAHGLPSWEHAVERLLSVHDRRRSTEPMP
jgi:hypothetical protein